jgi:hypothetical protein
MTVAAVTLWGARIAAVSIDAGWRGIAEEVGVEERIAEQIARSHRLALPAGTTTTR